MRAIVSKPRIEMEVNSKASPTIQNSGHVLLLNWNDDSLDFMEQEKRFCAA